MSASASTVTCTRAWGCEPRLVVGKVYPLVREYFRNGEFHVVIKDEAGKFEAPDIFVSDPS